jgi:polyisoprenoid-binding protein YceI
MERRKGLSDVLTRPRAGRAGRERAIVVAGALCLSSFSAVSFAALSAPTETQVTFSVSGPAGLKIDGTTSEFKLTDDGTNLVIVVPLGNLATGISLRDKHVRDDLEVSKYPEASIAISRSTLKFPPTGARSEAEATGTLTLHGQTKPVSIHYDAKADGSTITTHGKIHFNFNNFGVVAPSYLGVTVKPDTDVNATFKVSGS